MRSLVFDRMELAGAMGDLGTMLPLLIPLILINGVNATAALLVVGLAYIGAGLYYQIPIPVQPLKAVAIIAISGGFSAPTIAAAGILMGALLLFLATTGLIDQVSWVFTKPVIRGIQVALGLLLFIKGINFMLENSLFINGGPTFSGVLTPNLLIGVLCTILAVTLINNRKIPAALVLVTLGFATGAVLLRPQLTVGPQLPSLSIPSFQELREALVFLVIPQIPVTISNAVISASDLSKKYFGRKASKATPKALAVSMGITDLAAGTFGGVPLCHGSGGIVAHRRFGARTGGAPVLIGSMFVALAVAFGAGASSVLNLIPLPVLGVLLLFTGIQMMVLASDVKKKRDFAVVSLITGLAVATNMTVAFISGILVFHAWRRWMK